MCRALNQGNIHVYVSRKDTHFESTTNSPNAGSIALLDRLLDKLFLSLQQASRFPQLVNSSGTVLAKLVDENDGI